MATMSSTYLSFFWSYGRRISLCHVPSMCDTYASDGKRVVADTCNVSPQSFFTGPYGGVRFLRGVCRYLFCFGISFCLFVSLCRRSISKTEIDASDGKRVFSMPVFLQSKHIGSLIWICCVKQYSRMANLPARASDMYIQKHEYFKK